MIFRTTVRAALLTALLSSTSLSALAAETDYRNDHLLTTAAELVTAIGQETTESALDAENDLVIVDVRPADAFAEGHIPGAVQLDPDAVADPDAPVGGTLRALEDLAALIGDLGISADTQVVLYDDKGGFHAARMFWLLEYLGHRNVQLLDGGIQAWTAAEQTLATGAGKSPTPQRFAPAVTPRRYASADYILAHREDDDTLVIDVRPSNLFAKGHIPWAQSIPWKGNLEEDLTMKPADELIDHFAAHGVTADRNIVIHCQNGLASAHSYFALRLIGHPQVRTYHRSWAEWGTADDLPKAGSAG
ncbi:MAG: sulfurtransferase [Pseudomonadota bacterium]